MFFNIYHSQNILKYLDKYVCQTAANNLPVPFLCCRCWWIHVIVIFFPGFNFDFFIFLSPWIHVLEMLLRVWKHEINVIQPEQFKERSSKNCNHVLVYMVESRYCKILTIFFTVKVFSDHFILTRIRWF